MNDGKWCLHQWNQIKVIFAGIIRRKYRFTKKMRKFPVNRLCAHTSLLATMLNIWGFVLYDVVVNNRPIWYLITDYVKTANMHAKQWPPLCGVFSHNCFVPSIIISVLHYICGHSMYSRYSKALINMKYVTKTWMSHLITINLWWYPFTSGKSETEFWCCKEFLKKLKLINNKMFQRILVKYWDFQSIFKILQFLQKF